MKTKGLILLASALVMTGIVLAGCKKKEQPAAPPHEHEHESAALTEEAAEATAQVEQTMCPVMHNMKINKDIFTEYKGKKVYFCCPDCKAKFEADPEKYVVNLPQFKK